MNFMISAVTTILCAAILAASFVIISYPDDYLEEQLSTVRCVFQPNLIGCGDPYYK